MMLIMVLIMMLVNLMYEINRSVLRSRQGCECMTQLDGGYPEADRPNDKVWQTKKEQG